MPPAKFYQGLVTLREEELERVHDGWIGLTGILLRGHRMSKILAERNLKGIWAKTRVLDDASPPSCWGNGLWNIQTRIYSQMRTKAHFINLSTHPNNPENSGFLWTVLEKKRPEWNLLFLPLFAPSWVINPSGDGKYGARANANNCFSSIRYPSLQWQATCWVPGSPYCPLNTRQVIGGTCAEALLSSWIQKWRPGLPNIRFLFTLPPIIQYLIWW